jgi:hypothetical protein
MVLLPPPEEPTRANFCPGHTCRLSPLSTCTSRLLGYANLRAPHATPSAQFACRQDPLLCLPVCHLLALSSFGVASEGLKSQEEYPGRLMHAAGCASDRGG